MKYFFDSFVFDTDRRELRQGDAIVAMQPQVFDLLEYLIRNRDRVVSKEDILSAVWGGRIVSESSLTSRINAARAALGDSGEQQRLLRTLPRKGVRFIGAVREQGAESESASEHARAVARDQGEDARLSIAVLPLINLGGEADSLQFADALAEDLITELSRSPELFVVSRNSSFVYRDKSVDTRQIGQALGVKFVLEGSVRCLNGRIRVVVQLIDASDASHLWAERFDLCVDDVTTTQDELTREIVMAVRSRLTRGTSVRRLGVERRHLTVVSCRLSGIASLAERMEPDAMRELIETYQRECLRLVAQFGGVAALRGGDEVEAYFGHPLPNERSAECAVSTGLAIANAVSRIDGRRGRLRACVGIGTGVAVAGVLGPSAAATQSTAVGEPVDAARRLGAAASPEGVVICGATRRQLGGLFRYRAPGLAASDIGEAWQMVGESASDTRFAALHGERLSPLIGRDEELAMLARRWKAAKSGMGQVVLLRSEAGVGKSRLLQALRERIQKEAHEIVHYACAPHRAETAFFPIIDQIGRGSGFPPEALAEMRSGSDRLPAPASAASGAQSVIAAMLSPSPAQGSAAPLSPQKRKETIFRTVLDHLGRLAAGGPVVVEFEDAQWADSASLEYLTLLVERLHDQRILLIVTARPEFAVPWREPEYGLVLNLSRLDRRNASELVARVAGQNEIPPDVVGRILDRADGVPLFIEELTRAVIEGGEGHDDETLTRIPPTLEGSLLARLDRLSIADDILETAATLGRQFSHELIAALVPLAGIRLDGSLDRLISSGLASRRGTTPDAVYTFKHALVRDAIYARLASSARRALHARVAEILEQKFPETATSQPGLLAWHSLEGGAFAKAAEYALRAGKQAMAVSAMRETIAQLQLGLKAVGQMPEGHDRSAAELELQLARVAALVPVRGYSDPDTVKAYMRASELCRELGRNDQIIEIERGLYMNYLVAADFANAIRMSEEAYRAGRPGELGMGAALVHQGELAEAASWLERAYQRVLKIPKVARGSLDAMPVIAGRTALALCVALQGKHARAWELVGDAMDVQRTIDHPNARAFAMNTIARVCFLLRLEKENRTVADELADICVKHDFSYWLASAESYQAWHLAREGRDVEGSALIERALRRHANTGARWLYPFLFGLAGEIDRMAGRADAALRRLDDALAASAQTGEHWYDAALLRKRGEALRQLGRTVEAEECFVKALAVAERQGAQVFAPAIAAELARCWRDRGRNADARTLLVQHCHDLAPQLPWVSGASQLLAELG